MTTAALWHCATQGSNWVVDLLFLLFLLLLLLLLLACLPALPHDGRGAACGWGPVGCTSPFRVHWGGCTWGSWPDRPEGIHFAIWCVHFARLTAKGLHQQRWQSWMGLGQGAQLLPDPEGTWQNADAQQRCTPERAGRASGAWGWPPLQGHGHTSWWAWLEGPHFGILNFAWGLGVPLQIETTEGKCKSQSHEAPVGAGRESLAICQPTAASACHAPKAYWPHGKCPALLHTPGPDTGLGQVAGTVTRGCWAVEKAWNQDLAE